jgi:thioredoxin 1
MSSTPGTYALGFLAGALTTLSPCVLALIPILAASALAAHRLGVVALAAGLGVSFSVIGIFVASIGASLGVDGEVFRRVAAVLMILFGLAIFSNADGKPSIVYFHATWCPTCKVQQPIVERLAASPEMKDVTIFLADYDKEVALKRAMKVTQQSTFVVFKGGHEVARSTGQTREQDIKNTFAKAL